VIICLADSHLCNPVYYYIADYLEFVDQPFPFLQRSQSLNNDKQFLYYFIEKKFTGSADWAFFILGSKVHTTRVTKTHMTAG